MRSGASAGDTHTHSHTHVCIYLINELLYVWMCESARQFASCKYDWYHLCVCVCVCVCVY